MERAVRKADQKFGVPCQLLLVVLPNTGRLLYEEVKRAGDHSLGVVSQCVVEANLLKPGRDGKIAVSPQYTGNVALKVRVPSTYVHALVKQCTVMI
jgi:hypothetical protein